MQYSVILLASSFILNLIILIVSACSFVKIIKNDLTHVQRDLGEQKVKLDQIGDRIENIAERVSNIEGKLSNKKYRKKR